MRSIGVLLALLCLTDISVADEAMMVPIPDFAPPSIPFDVQGGLVEAWSRYLPCEANSAQFKATILQSHKSADWNSQVRVSISDNATVTRKLENFDPNAFDNAVAVTLVSDDNGIADSASFAVIELQAKDRKNKPFSIYAAKIRNNHEYNVVVRWSDKGDVSASIDGGEFRHFDMNKRATTITFFVSGTKAEIHDLRVGRIGPKPEGKDACNVS